MQPVSVASVAGGGDEKERLVRIEVDLSVLDGTAEYTPQVLAIQDAEGNLYPAVEDATARVDERAARQRHARSGPIRARRCLRLDTHIGGCPKIVLLTPDGSVVTSWSLSSH